MLGMGWGKQEVAGQCVCPAGVVGTPQQALEARRQARSVLFDSWIVEQLRLGGDRPGWWETWGLGATINYH